ncbi:hypothetical protein Btru_066036, partial [Bulinus truncatus]
MMSPKEIDQGVFIDQILISLKWNGRYQITRCIVPFLAYVSLAISSMSVIFIGKMVQHKCKPPENFSSTIDQRIYGPITNTSDVILNVTYGACGIHVMNSTDVMYTIPCPDGYEYIEPMYTSFVSEWDLVCDQESLSDVSLTVDYLSEMIWSIVISTLSDVYGRKRLFMLTNTMYFINALVTCVLPNFVAFMVVKFLQTGCALFSNVVVMEMMPTKHRALPTQVLAYLWPSSLLLLCLIAYLTKDLSWRYTQLIIASLSGYVVVQWWISDESLRWLCVNQKQKEAEELVRKIARINKVSPEKALHILGHKIFAQDVTNENQIYKPRSVDVQIQEENIKMLSSTTDSTTSCDEPTKIRGVEKNVKFSTFLKNRNLLKIVFVSSSLWFTDCLAYNGLLMTSSTLAENIYLGFALGVLVEYPAGVTYNVLINRVGRRRCVVVAHLITGLALIISTLFHIPTIRDNIQGSGWISLGFSLFG